MHKALIRKLAVESKRDHVSALAYADYLEETGGDEWEIKILRRFAMWDSIIRNGINTAPEGRAKLIKLPGYGSISVKKTAKIIRYRLWKEWDFRARETYSGWLTNRKLDNPHYIAKFVRSVCEASIPQTVNS